MIKYTYSIFLVLIGISTFMACNKTKYPVFCIWKIDKISGKNPFMENAVEVKIFEDHIVFMNKNQSMTFPVLIRDKHMVLQSKTTKWLFTIDQQDDNTLMIKEKYAVSPFWILLKK
ncbi:MAG TPA: hypothetical protein DCX89_03630 [Saprospirales bacterium]|nr:hypothetical protein [Saprospirales bacterium]HRQ28487.1 hypothetical protein [Saprospiraceae bacterium]